MFSVRSVARSRVSLVRSDATFQGPPRHELPRVGHAPEAWFSARRPRRRDDGMTRRRSERLLMREFLPPSANSQRALQ